MIDGIGQNGRRKQYGLHWPPKQKLQFVQSQQTGRCCNSNPDGTLHFPQWKNRMRTGKGQRHSGEQTRIDIIATDLSLTGDPQALRSDFQFFRGDYGTHLPEISFCTSTGSIFLAASPNFTR